MQSYHLRSLSFNTEHENDVTESTPDRETNEPPMKRFKHLKQVAEGDMKLDPFNYWLQRETSFPNLTQVACEILSTPASTAPVKRIFSTGGEATRRKRNRLSDKNLENEIFLRRNKKYIQL